MKVAAWCAAALALAIALPTSAEEATPLSKLLQEAAGHNSNIAAAEHGVRAARMIASQMAALPDPMFTVQQFAVGSPKPFAGYTNSDFAYVGIGASQELPYPGKLRLRAEVADREADTKAADEDATEADVAEAVKLDYLQLAYLQQTVSVLIQNRDVLDQMIEDAMARYKVGQGMQQDILQAQIERTGLVRELTMHHAEMGTIQAHLKGLLHRSQISPDIVAEGLTETSLRMTAQELLGLIQKQNPQVQIDASAMRKQDAQLVSAKREGKPDFEVGYMYQNTDRKYRDYYMLTFNVRLPRRQRVNAEIGKASEMLAQSKEALDAHLQQQLAETQEEYVKASSDAELLKEYREGLIPQSEAAYRATLSAYGSDTEQFAHVLQSFTGILRMKLAYAQVLEEHEASLARLETLTGSALR
jgi:cobalt-zinc-cadmium efflux system outer membrane protein